MYQPCRGTCTQCCFVPRIPALNAELIQFSVTNLYTFTVLFFEKFTFSRHVHTSVYLSLISISIPLAISSINLYNVYLYIYKTCFVVVYIDAHMHLSNKKYFG